MPSDSLLVHNAAKALGVPRQTVRHWAATGKLEATKPAGKIWQISRAAVEAQLAARLRDLNGHDIELETLFYQTRA